MNLADLFTWYSVNISDKKKTFNSVSLHDLGGIVLYVEAKLLLF